MTGEGGQPPPSSIGRGDPDDTDPHGRTRRSRPARRVAGLVAAVGVVVGAALGGLAAAETGPFAPDAPVVPPTFDPGVYVGSPRPLPVVRALASSTHPPQGDTTYGPGRLVDGDLTTAWNSDGSDRVDGIGETLRLELAQRSWVDSVVIANGDQRDDRSFVANARVQRVQLTLADQTFEVAVLDRTGRQVIELPDPILTDGVTLTVTSSHPGDTYPDLAVSEIELVGWPAVGQDLGPVVPASAPTALSTAR